MNNFGIGIIKPIYWFLGLEGITYTAKNTCSYFRSIKYCIQYCTWYSLDILYGWKCWWTKNLMKLFSKEVLNNFFNLMKWQNVANNIDSLTRASPRVSSFTECLVTASQEGNWQILIDDYKIKITVKFSCHTGVIFCLFCVYGRLRFQSYIGLNPRSHFG